MIVIEPYRNFPYQLIDINEINFGILLKKDFAEKMLETELNYNKRKRTNQLGEKICKNLGITEIDPYAFYRNTALLRQANFRRSN